MRTSTWGRVGAVALYAALVLVTVFSAGYLLFAALFAPWPLGNLLRPIAPTALAGSVWLLRKKRPRVASALMLLAWVTLVIANDTEIMIGQRPYD